MMLVPHCLVGAKKCVGVVNKSVCTEEHILRPNEEEAEDQSWDRGREGRG